MRMTLRTLALTFGAALALETGLCAATRGIDINKKTYPVTGIDSTAAKSTSRRW